MLVLAQLQVNLAMGTNNSPYHLSFVLVKIWMFIFPLYLDDMMSITTKNYLKCGLIRSQHTFPVRVSSSQMSPGPEKSFDHIRL